MKNEFKYANEAILIKYALICILGIKLAKFVFVSIIYDFFLHIMKEWKLVMKKIQKSDI